MRLYVCYEREVYEGMEWFCWADSDEKAIKIFMKDIKEWKGEYFIGKLKDNSSEYGVVLNQLPVEQVKIIKELRGENAI